MEKQVEHTEGQKRLERLRELETAEMFDRMRDSRPWLQSHVRSRVVNADLEGIKLEIDTTLFEATEKGCQVLEEAEQHLVRGMV